MSDWFILGWVVAVTATSNPTSGSAARVVAAVRPERIDVAAIDL